MNLVFIAGPHGAGKTTLVQKLQEADVSILVPRLQTKTPKLHTDPLTRSTLKIGQRAIENFEAGMIAQEHPDRIVIGNRCIYDVFAYAQVYRDLQWITEKDCRRLESAARFIFPESLQEPYAMILNPPEEVVRERLEKRWKEKNEKKWEEENEMYNTAACRAYQQFEDHQKILYLAGNESVAYIRGWLKNINESESDEVALVWIY